ncbi:MAG TPA: hypothetical protein VJ385_20490 [Fibrobacteria bacterium]|nr:hypothetical protein [Fibrobacteria bacterium]
MRVSLHALKRGRLLPGVALIVAFFFLTGRFFACCRFNQNVGAAVSRVLHGPVSFGQHGHSDPDHDPGSHHCHVHTADAQAAPSVSSHGPADACTLAEKDECLSEHAWSGKPMVQSEFVSDQGLLPPAPILAEDSQPLPRLFERPRPRNKSSPPLYLTTLRILV